MGKRTENGSCTLSQLDEAQALMCFTLFWIKCQCTTLCHIYRQLVVCLRNASPSLLTILPTQLQARRTSDQSLRLPPFNNPARHALALPSATPFRILIVTPPFHSSMPKNKVALYKWAAAPLRWYLWRKHYSRILQLPPHFVDRYILAAFSFIFHGIQHFPDSYLFFVSS